MRFIYFNFKVKLFKMNDKIYASIKIINYIIKWESYKGVILFYFHSALFPFI